MEVGFTIEVDSGVKGKDSFEMWWLLGSCHELAPAKVRAAGHAHIAVAPGLLCDPFDEIKEVLLLLGAHHIPRALGIVRAPHIRYDVGISPGYPELGDACLVLV
jgi:hypothetical protein